jgi:putative SOS response-associated peptidase YedK
MRAYPVSRAVNDPTNDSPEVVQPLDTDGSEAS